MRKYSDAHTIFFPDKWKFLQHDDLSVIDHIRILSIGPELACNGGGYERREAVQQVAREVDAFCKKKTWVNCMELLHPRLPTDETTKLIYDDIGLFMLSISNRKIFLFPKTKSLILQKKKKKEKKQEKEKQRGKEKKNSAKQLLPQQ